MAKIVNRFQPTLFEFPIQNNRTGWHPVWTPTLLVVPWSFDTDGRRIEGSKVNNVRFAIENPIQIDVAGHPQDYSPLGLKPEASPDLIIFEVNLTHDDLIQYRIDTSDGTFVNADGNVVEDPEEGDYLQLTNDRGIVGEVEYLPDAEYFDLSSVEINVDNLPSDRYIASWTVNYHNRIDANGVLFCIENVEKTNKLNYLVNHPGEIHEEMVRRTPSVYFEDVDKKQDSTVNLYRPFADILQDHFDESELFYGINWLDKIPPQLFPYLAYLIGLELPTQSTNKNIDKIRKTMLERGTDLQKLKGSELAIKELFSILGFVVEIIDLWVSSDGNRFIAPNDTDPNPIINKKDEIELTTVSQTDPMIANYSESGFGNFEVPLLYHNKSDEIVINAYIVKSGSDAHNDLKLSINNLISDSDYFTQDTIINEQDGYLMLPSDIKIDSDGVEAFSRVVVSDIEVLSQNHSGLPVIRFDGIKYNRLKDRVSINFADYKDLSNSVAYIFVTYKRDKIEVPEHLRNNQSNRFDVNIVSKSGDIEPSLYDYLIDSLLKFKAFHSLLRKISYDAELRDFYNVTDFCTNSFLSRQNTFDQLMAPPACPEDECFVTDECNEQNARGGFRQSDLETRNIILEGLKEEYDRWHDVTKQWLKISDQNGDYIKWAKSVSNVDIQIPDSDGDNYGQDRVSFDFVVRSDIDVEVGDKFNMVYMGSYLQNIGSDDFIFNIIPTQYQILSSLSGIGVSIEIVRIISKTDFYVNMSIDIDHQSDVRSKITQLNRTSTPDYCYKGRVRDFIKLDNVINLKTIIRNKPCKLMMGLGLYYDLDHGGVDAFGGWYGNLLNKSDRSLHYTNDLFFEDTYKGSHLRPSIEIEKTNWGLPGHRQIRSGLSNDFTHPEHGARPWDELDVCFGLRYPLNARIEISGENEELVFDDEPLVYESDDTIPDIIDYSGLSSKIFTHSIYTTTSNNIYVSLDSTSHTTMESVDTEVDIFNTAKQCGTSTYSDYVDGYPANTGDINFDYNNVLEDRETLEFDEESTDIVVSATYDSELLMENGTEQENPIQGYRYDCECLEYLCSDDDRNCNQFFLNNDGSYDFNNDKLEIDYAISLLETFSGQDNFYDGSIGNWINYDFGSTEPREFEYKDEYGIIYKVMYEENVNTLDISYETFQPRVWGQKDDGYVENGKVFRKGILTTIRQIFILNNGLWELNAEGTTQDIVFRQTNYDCDVLPPEDKFIYRHEYIINDDVEIFASKGPQWVDHGDSDVIWGGYSGTSGEYGKWDSSYWDSAVWDVLSGDESGFEFIDAWGSYESNKKYIPCQGVVQK